MRLYTYRQGRREKIGVEFDGRLLDIARAHAQGGRGSDEPLAETMLELIRGGEKSLKKLRRLVRRVHDHPKDYRRSLVRMEDVRIQAPIPRPGKIFCSGLNYRSHVEENPSATFLDDPRFFVKVPSAVIGPGEPIRWPGAKFQVDFEVELAVVIGATAHRLTQANAMDHVFGYTILHDVSARWIQFKDKNEDMGKNFDTFAPMGPCLVTRDEIPDPSALRLSLKVNGRTMQDGSNADWCFSLPRMLEWFSMGITLEPGDVVSTGTPAGVGFFQKPQVFLQPGDVCELEVEGIGKLINPVVEDEYPWPSAFAGCQD